MRDECNVGLVQWWDEKKMDFCQADLVLSLNDKTNCLVNDLGMLLLKYFISFKKYDSEGTYTGSRHETSAEIVFNVGEKNCGGYFCDLNDNRIICTEFQVNIINGFIDKTRL